MIQKLIGKIKHVVEYFKKTIKKIRDPYWRARCKYIKYYEDLPVREDTILLESQAAREISGNIFYLLKYISYCYRYSNFKIYISSWVRYQKKIQGILDQYEIKNTTITIYSSDEYIRLLASAKFLINDNTFPPYYIKKRGQIYLNTWHGTPLKTLGKQIQNDISIGNTQKNFLDADYLLYPNPFTKEVMIRDYMLKHISVGSSILAGYPRNEVFFDNDRRIQVREELGVEGKRLYANLAGDTQKGRL